MKLEVTKLELIKLRSLLKKYKKSNSKNVSFLNNAHISYLAINQILNDDLFHSLYMVKKGITQIKPIELLIDKSVYQNLNFNKIDSDIRKMIDKIGGMNNLTIIYDILSKIDIYNENIGHIKTTLENSESIREVLNFYKHNLRDYYLILNDLMNYYRIRFKFSKNINSMTYYETITNRYFIRINNDNTILRNIILSHEFMHVAITNKDDNTLFSETKPIIAEKLYINSLIKDNNYMYNSLYFNRINDTSDKVFKYKYIYEFLTSFDIENNFITKVNIDKYINKHNINISQILAIFEWIKYDEIIASMGYIYSDILSNIMIKQYNGDIFKINKYIINSNNITDICLNFYNEGYIKEYNNFTKTIKEKIK